MNLEYLRFAGSRYKNDVVLTDAEIADYAAKNEAKLKELYEQKRFVYEKVSDERKLRQILIKVPHDATDAQDKAARDKANALAEKLKKGAKVSGKDGVTFAEVARSSSDDAASKAQGGELGWRAPRRGQPAGGRRGEGLEGARPTPSSVRCAARTATSSPRSRESATGTSRSSRPSWSWPSRSCAKSAPTPRPRPPPPRPSPSCRPRPPSR